MTSKGVDEYFPNLQDIFSFLHPSQSHTYSIYSLLLVRALKVVSTNLFSSQSRPHIDIDGVYIDDIHFPFVVFDFS